MPPLTFLLLLLFFSWGLIASSGRNIGVLNAEDFAVWHREYGKTLHMVSWWGLAILALSLVVRAFD